MCSATNFDCPNLRSSPRHNYFCNPREYKKKNCQMHNPAYFSWMLNVVVRDEKDICTHPKSSPTHIRAAFKRT